MENEKKIFDDRQKELEAIGATLPVDEAEKKAEEDKKAADEAAAEEEKRLKDSEEEDSEDEEDDSEEEEEEESDDEDDEDEDEEDDPKNTSSKDLREMKKRYKNLIKGKDSKIEELENQLKEATTSKDKKEIEAELEEEIKKTAERLKVDPAVLMEIAALSRKAVGKDLEKLKEIEAKEKEREEEEFNQNQVQIFKNEWTALEPSLKQQFPNATPEQIAKAQAEMDKLSHTKEYHKYDLDYILFKEKKTFDKILFSPNKKTFESANRLGEPADDSDPFTLPENFGDMTPAAQEKFMQKREAAMAAMPKEKVQVNTTDESGNSVSEWR